MTTFRNSYHEYCVDAYQKLPVLMGDCVVDMLNLLSFDNSEDIDSNFEFDKLCELELMFRGLLHSYHDLRTEVKK